MEVVSDIETESLNPSKIWVLCAIDVATEEEYTFRDPVNNPDFHKFATKVTKWIGHNFISFDAMVVNRLCYNVHIPLKNVLDTLVVSRLLNYNIDGGHSLDAWGKRLGFPKMEFKEFDKFSEKTVTYCMQDCRVNLQLYKYFLKWLNSEIYQEALQLEHDTAIVCSDMSSNGFFFDIKKARKLHEEVCGRIEQLLQGLQRAFPPKTKLIREITPKETASGTISRVDFRWTDDLTPYTVGHPFSRVDFVPFNPGSPKQVVARLHEAGWKPFEKTKGHLQAERERNEEKLKEFRVYGWKVNEANLETVPEDAPEAVKTLVQWLLLDSRRSTLEEWFNAYNEATGRIHGHFNNIGAWTQRMSHQAPNMANIPSADSKYHAEDLKAMAKYWGTEMRSCWIAPEGKVLVGVDADGIQLRVLAHYMNDEEFTHALVNGNSDDGTDAHSLNAKRLGGIPRPRAKTFIYAWLLGAGFGKVGSILDVSMSEARSRVASFIESYPGLERVKKELIPSDAKRGYFIGLDGRYVPQTSTHLMLAGYLQNGESLIMKKANQLWRAELFKLKIPFKQVNFVHDEWVVETYPQYADVVSEVLAQAIVDAGVYFKLNCPLAGSGEVGKTWYDIH